MRRTIPMTVALLLLVGIMATLALCVSFHERAAPNEPAQSADKIPTFGLETQAGTANPANVGVVTCVTALTAAAAVSIRRQRG